MVDRFERRIHYLRISVTPRCNLSCRYCQPPAGACDPESGELLALTEIQALVQAAAGMGIDKIRFTGGEPLLREDIAALVELACHTPGIADVGITTNGVLLPQYVQSLRRAGLRRLNISLDTLSPERFREISPVGALADVLAGLDAALAAGFETIKLNCVIEQSAEEPDARAVAEFGRRHSLPVRFIRRMDLRAGAFWPVIGGEGGHCERCNRLRVTSDGYVLPCLFDDRAYSSRELGAELALRRALENKPAKGTRSNRRFHTIGG